MKTPPAPRHLKKRVLIVDDHPILRDGLSKVINQQDDLEICGEASDAQGGLAAIAKCHPDVVIVDLTLEEGSGLDLIKDIHTRNSKLPVLVLSMHHESLYAERAVRAGAQGYVMKREPVGNVIMALHKVLGGHMALSENIVSQLIGAPERANKPEAGLPTDLLSNRELEVFRLLGQGLGTRKIAAKLRVAASTVETHRAGIKEKLGLGSATELIARAALFVAEQTGG
jgi:DNA-binding NarL/FixJ family response regulator